MLQFNNQNYKFLSKRKYHSVSEFSFSKNYGGNVECMLCNIICFLIVDAMTSLNTQKHKLALQNRASSSSMLYLCESDGEKIESHLSLTAQEVTFAYHTAVHTIVSSPWTVIKQS